MNNLFQQIIGIINGVETYHKAKNGEEKKAICLKYVDTYVNGLKASDPEQYLLFAHFIDNYLNDMIDLIVFLVKNKEMIKLFKSGKGCISKLFFNKKSDEADKLVDEIFLGQSPVDVPPQ